MSQTCGWAGLLGDALSQRYGLCLATEAISGTTAASTKWTLQASLSRHRPKVVVIGLAPANEGLPYYANTQAEADRIGTAFLRGLRKLADDAAAFPGVQQVVLGGVYPHGKYTPMHAAILRRCADEMSSWPYAVIDFLNPTAEGASGRWRAGLSQAKDMGSHPNAEGYRRMFEAIDLGMFAGARQSARA